MSDYVIGLDFGTESVRALLVDAASGEQLSSGVYHFSRFMNGKYCVPEKNLFRHHPLDYIEGLEGAILQCLEGVGKEVRDNVRGISADTTGSTPGPLDKEGTLLALRPEFQDNLNAMFLLWKDHTSVQETTEITSAAKNWGGIDFTRYSGGFYSAEWFWAKLLHTLRVDTEVRRATYSWIELCDWIPAVLTGTTNVSSIKRSRCAAGHKAMWHQSWGGLPDEKFLSGVDRLLASFREKLYTTSHTSDRSAGTLSPEWAKRLGLKGEVIVGVGAFDAHMGAIGVGIKPYTLVKIMGTSTCDIIVVPREDLGDRPVKGICGQVDGSVLPDMIGLEAGQSAVGDVFDWFVSLVNWPVSTILEDIAFINSERKRLLITEIQEKTIPVLTSAAKQLPIDESIVALDWLNGRRTPDANQFLKGAITGLNLGSDAPRIFRTLVEATAFGARSVNDRFESEGIPIKEIIAIGGVSKSEFIMQITADILGRSIKMCGSDQVCALGAAICAATASGIYRTIPKAQQRMNGGFTKEYNPIMENHRRYNRIYQSYRELGAFVEDTTIRTLHKE